jgi:hypothetical protein
MRSVTRFIGIILTLTLGGVVAGAAAPTGQMLVGLRAEWQDLETWSHAIESTRETELGLGLHVTGKDGTTLIAFMGRLSARDPRQAPQTIDVQVSTGRMTNPALVRRAVLSFVLDDDTQDRKALDLSSALRVDNPSPGAIITDGVATMDPKDLVRLASAKTARSTILGFDGTLRENQIVAIKALAERLHLPVK